MGIGGRENVGGSWAGRGRAWEVAMRPLPELVREALIRATRSPRICARCEDIGVRVPYWEAPRLPGLGRPSDREPGCVRSAARVV